MNHIQHIYIPSKDIFECIRILKNTDKNLLMIVSVWCLHYIKINEFPAYHEFFKAYSKMIDIYEEQCLVHFRYYQEKMDIYHNLGKFCNRFLSENIDDNFIEEEIKILNAKYKK